MTIRSLLPILLALCLTSFSWAQEASNIIYEDENGCLRYVSDDENNYLPDFSYSGYKNSEEPFPELTVVMTISPIEGDNTSHIQAALDEVADMPLDENGFRGALLLEAGIYEIHGTVVIRESGIVLRGVGDDSDPTTNTVLVGIGNSPAERDIIQMGNAPEADWLNEVPETRSVVNSEFIPAGSRSLKVVAPELYSEGDNVIILHPSTAAWLASINYGDTDTDDPWSPGTIDILYNRYITEIDLEESKIILDVPIYDHLEAALSAAEVYVLNKEGFKQNIGIENLRVDIQTEGPLTENHAKNAIRLIGVEDCWLTEVTALHFVYAAVDTRAASRVTVKDCRGLEPHSKITGGRRYNFAVGRMSNQILFENCHATEGRHSFVSNGTSSVSGIVFYNCTSEIDYSSSEGHRRWSQGLLYDNITFSASETNTLVGLYNRGRFGTGHGWSTVNGVAWGVRVPFSRNIKLQKPPGRQNYAIGCQALVTNQHTFQHPIGYEELTNQTPLITSLYLKQLEARMQGGISPDAPARLNAEFMDGMVALNWLDIASRETGYSLEWSTDGGISFAEIALLPADQNSYLHADLPTTSGPIIYRVFAIGEHCPSPYSNRAQVEVVSGTPFIPIPDLEVFPNPFQDRINIQTDAQINEIRFFDNAGKEVFRKASASQLLTADLAPGGYYLQISDAQGRTSLLRMMKQ